MPKPGYFSVGSAEESCVGLEVGQLRFFLLLIISCANKSVNYMTVKEEILFKPRSS